MSSRLVVQNYVNWSKPAHQGEKACILVEAHQLVVDNLSKLPAIRSMSLKVKAFKEHQAALVKQRTASAPAVATSSSNVVERSPG
ncbi:hypothetical protein AN958_08980 [Leucoagaricus sp. SymC.cos]|nr:hypothetical protein AN958_08980 [Leucoagaricus sp. SymC.cos]